MILESTFYYALIILKVYIKILKIKPQNGSF